MTPACCAILVGPLPDVAARVAGLSIPLRALLSLQDAGIREVYLVDIDAAQLPADPRLRLSISSAPAPRGAALVAFVDGVWHPGVASRLAKAPLLADEILRAGPPDEALFAAGEEAVAPLLAGLRTGRCPETREEPLSPQEFALRASYPAAQRRAERLLLGSLLKPTDGLVSRHLNRKISLWITSHLLNSSITPNQMTLIAAVFGLLGVWFAWQGSVWPLVLGALLLQVQSILDGCDGELARLKYLRGRLGEWLDQISDDVINIGFLAAVGLALHREGSAVAGWVTAVAVTSHTLYQISLYAAFLTKAGGRGSVTTLRWWGQGGASAPPRAPGARVFSYVKKFIEDAGKRDFFTFLYLPGALLGCVEIAFWWHALIATVSGLVTTLQWVLAGGPEAVNK